MHFKSQTMGFQNSGLRYKLQGCFFIVGAPVLGPFLRLSAQLQIFPCSQPGWYPVKVHPKCLFSGCSMSCINICVVRTFHSMGYPATEDNLCGRVYHRIPNCRTSNIMGHRQHTYSMSPDTLWCKTPHAPSCRTEEQLQHEKLDYQDHVFQSVK